LLSNIYLHPLDKALWKEHKDRYLRYSDDIAVFSTERENLEKTREHIEQCLADLKLNSNTDKTIISHVSKGVFFLGFFMDMKGKGPDKNSVKELENKLTRYDKIRITDHIQEKLQEIETRIRGWHNYYKTLKPISPPNILALIALVRLSSEFGETVYAKELLKQTESYQHNHPEISFQTGELFYEFGMHPQAMREYARTLERDPSMEKAKERIRTLQAGEENIHHVIEETKIVLHHNPHYREGYQKLAEYYTKLGLYGFAEKAHQKALGLEDNTEANGFLISETAQPINAEKDFAYNVVDQELFLNLFRGRKKAHARQWVDDLGKWGFMHVDRHLKEKDIYRHLKGETTLGIYPTTEQDTVHLIVFDVDVSNKVLLEAKDTTLEDFRKKAHEDILRIKTVCEHMGFAMYIEDSGYKGRHGWLLFTDEIPASWAIHLGSEIMKKAGNPSPQMVWELFPMGKSERHRSIIKLPLGINKKNNRRCLFLADSGVPVADQALYLKTIRKNDIKAMKAIEEPQHPDKKGISYGNQDKILAPPGIEIMVNRCKVLNHLILKARDTNYLSHHERICLLYTLSFAGDEGCRFLHKVISYCINYDYNYTQRQIERRKESPISCARIMENFQELAETLPCNCKFDLPPRSYPSPVLYLLEAEIEGTVKQSIFARDNNGEPDIEAKAAKGIERENKESAKEVILDFERIFSDEPTDEIIVADPDDHPESPDSPTPQGSKIGRAYFQTENQLQLKKDAISQETAGDALTDEPISDDKQSGVATDIGELFIEYLNLKTEHEKVVHALNQVSYQLTERFDRLNSTTLQTNIGTIHKSRREDGSSTWKLEI